MDKVGKFGKHFYFVLIFLARLKIGFSYVPSSQLFPYLEESGATHFDYGDDGYVNVTLQRSFNFLGTTYSNAFMNGNGIISFDKGTGAYSYNCDRNRSSIPTIAVYMADSHQNLEQGDILIPKLSYRQDTTALALDKISQDVITAFPSLNNKISLNWMLVLTWINIPPYKVPLKHYRNTFQAVLTTDGRYSFVIFYYNSMTWPLPTIAAGVAQAGIYGGSLNINNSYLIPGSCNYSLINIGGMSNIHDPGKFVFRVDNHLEIPEESKCIPKVRPLGLEPIQFVPSVVPIFGGVSILIRDLHLCLNYNVTIATCEFHDTSRQSPVKVVSSMVPGQLALVCQTPIFYSLGRVRVDIALTFSNNETFNVHGYVYVVRATARNTKLSTRVNKSGNVFLVGAWDPAGIKMLEIQQFFKNTVNRDFPAMPKYANLTVMDLSGNRWGELQNFRNVSNNGILIGGVHEHVQSKLLTNKLEAQPITFKVSNTVIMENGDELKAERFADVTHTTFALAKLKVMGNGSNFFDKKCKQWHDHEPAPPTDSIPCPVTLQQALADWRFLLDAELSTSKVMNPHNFTFFIQSTHSLSGAGSQCVYDNEDSLVLGYPYGSRLHRFSPNNWKHYWNHYWEDVIPYLQCCLLSYNKEENCKIYFFNKRPSYHESEYKPPFPFRVSGATHIYTVDGLNYVISAIGTFWILKYPNTLEIQILLEKYENSGENNQTTVVSTAALKCFGDDGTPSKFQISANSIKGMLIWLDEEPLNFYHENIFNQYEYMNENFTLFHDGVTLVINGTSEATFSFSSGLSIKFSLSSGNKSLNIIGSASDALMGKVSGLLGNFDGNLENDFSIKDGSLLAPNSTIDDISKMFVEQWRVPPNESLFLFPSGKSYEDYNDDSNFQPCPFTRTQILENAQTPTADFCKNVQDCRIDYFLTQNKDFAQTSYFKYLEFEALLNVTVMTDVSPRKCPSPTIISHGGYLGNSSRLGATIQPYCDHGYDLQVKNDMNFILHENLILICLPDELNPKKSSENINQDRGATWLSNDSLPLLNYSIACVSNSLPDYFAQGDLLQAVKVTPLVIPIIGNNSLSLGISHQLDTKNLVSVTCKFSAQNHASSIKTRGTLDEVLANSFNIACPVPVLQTLGRVNIDILMNYLGKPSLHFESYLWVQNLEDASSKLIVHASSEGIAFSWNIVNYQTQNDLSSSCDLSLVIIPNNAIFAKDVHKLGSTMCSSGSYQVSSADFISTWNQTDFHGIFTSSVTFVMKNGYGQVIAASDLLSAITSLHDVVFSSSFVDSQENIDNSTSSNEPEYLNGDSENESEGNAIFNSLCEQWHDQEKSDNSAKASLPCPRTLGQAQIDWRFSLEHQSNWEYLNPEGHTVFVQSVPSPFSKSGSVCMYDENGNMIFGPPGGSRIDRYSSNGWDNYWKHFTHDTLPYLYCCKWGNSITHCHKYFYGIRGIPPNGNYTPPKYAHAWGATHLQTFDDTQLSLNGSGEVWMIKTRHEYRKWHFLQEFQCQTRLEPYHRHWSVVSDETANVSVITSVAMQQTLGGSKTIIQISHNISLPRGFEIRLNGYQMLLPNELKTFYYEGLTLQFNDMASPEIIVVFQAGISFRISVAAAGEPALNIIFSASTKFCNEMDGLLKSLPSDTNEGIEWLVQETQSIFPQQKTSRLSNVHLQPVDFLKALDMLPELDTDAVTFCENSVDCIIDFLATNSEAFARSSQEETKYFQRIIDASATRIKECSLPTEVQDVTTASGLSLGSSFMMTCEANTLVNFTCVEDENSFKWMPSHGNSGSTLTSCLQFRNRENGKGLSVVVILLVSAIIVMIVLFIAVLTLIFILVKRSSEINYFVPLNNHHTTDIELPEWRRR